MKQEKDIPNQFRIEEIIYKGSTLSHPSNKKNFEQFIRVITFFYRKHSHHWIDADSEYERNGAIHQYFPCSWKTGRGITSYWNEIRDSLIENGILVANHSYSNNSKLNRTGKTFPKSYKLHEDFLKSHCITLSTPKLQPGDSTTEEEGIRIRCQKSAIQELNRISKERIWPPFVHNYYHHIILNFSSCPWSPMVGVTGREFNIVNRLPSELRKHITINDNNTVELDIKSCNPTILFMFCEGKEKELWGKLIDSGHLYEYFMLHASFHERKACKSAFVRLLGGAKGEDILRLKQGMKPEFGKLLSFIEETEKAHHGEVARILQKVESSIVVDRMKAFPHRTISIHDGIMVEAQHADEAKAFLSEAFEEEVGVKPVIEFVESQSACESLELSGSSQNQSHDSSNTVADIFFNRIFGPSQSSESREYFN